MSKPRFGTKQKHIIGERRSLEIDIHKTGEELMNLKMTDCIQAVTVRTRTLDFWFTGKCPEVVDRPEGFDHPETWDLKGLTDLFLFSSVQSYLSPTVIFQFDHRCMIVWFIIPLAKFFMVPWKMGRRGDFLSESHMLGTLDPYPWRNCRGHLVQKSFAFFKAFKKRPLKTIFVFMRRADESPAVPQV